MAKKPNAVISSRADADAALQRLIEGAEKEADDHIALFRQSLIEETAPMREALADNEAALKAWAKTDRKNWKDKSLELNFGTIGFRLPKAAIKLKLALEISSSGCARKRCTAASAPSRKSTKRRWPTRRRGSSRRRLRANEAEGQVLVRGQARGGEVMGYTTMKTDSSSMRTPTTKSASPSVERYSREAPQINKSMPVTRTANPNRFMPTDRLMVVDLPLRLLGSKISL